MIHRLILVITIAAWAISGIAQNAPHVPSKMNFAGITLKITDKGKRALQEEVDRITQSPKYFQAQVEKADIYFPLIEKAFREENIPEDFKYLALQESALIPDVVSKSNAVGYWQFKDFTAMEMGLRVDRQIDERMHIISSSRAAARYMKKNNFYFNNWLFALQAYQMGAGAALKAIDKSQHGTKTITITHKTYWYVKTFLAHKIAYQNAVGKSAGTTELVVYKKGEGKTLYDIARETNIEYEKIEPYNKWLRKGRIPTDKTYLVIIPTDRLQNISFDTGQNTPKRLVKKVPAIDVAQSNRFPIVKKMHRYAHKPRIMQVNGLPGLLAVEGDAIRDIAAKGNVDIGKFLKYNDIQIDHRIVAGNAYYLKKKKKKAKAYYHVTQVGETLWGVSQKYGMQLNSLKMKNRIRKEQTIKEGRVLWLRHIRPATIPIEYREVTKAVNEKTAVPDPVIVQIPDATEEHLHDSLDVSDMLEIENDNSNTEAVLITLEADTINQIDQEQDSVVFQEINKVRHNVKLKETLYRISKYYDVEVMEIVKWNRLDITQGIQVGQELIIYTSKPLVVEENANSQEPAPEENVVKYEVKPGDTLYKIAREFDINVTDIIEWNGKADHDVSVGEILLIKSTRAK